MTATLINVGSEYIWFWVSTKIQSKIIIKISISKERNTCLLQGNFISAIVKEHGKHLVSTKDADVNIFKLVGF